MPPSPLLPQPRGWCANLHGPWNKVQHRASTGLNSFSNVLSCRLPFSCRAVSHFLQRPEEEAHVFASAFHCCFSLTPCLAMEEAERHGTARYELILFAPCQMIEMPGGSCEPAGQSASADRLSRLTSGLASAPPASTFPSLHPSFVTPPLVSTPSLLP